MDHGTLDPGQIVSGMFNVAVSLKIDSFKQPILLACALRLVRECKTKTSVFDAKRLETIGDRIINRIINQRLVDRQLPINVIHARNWILHSNAAFAYCALHFDFERVLERSGVQIERVDLSPEIGARHPLADLFERIAGAIWLDRGRKSVEKFLDMYFWPLEDDILVHLASQQKIRQLNVSCQRKGFEQPRIFGPYPMSNGKTGYKVFIGTHCIHEGGDQAGEVLIRALTRSLSWVARNESQ